MTSKNLFMTTQLKMGFPTEVDGALEDNKGIDGQLFLRKCLYE